MQFFTARVLCCWHGEDEVQGFFILRVSCFCSVVLAGSTSHPGQLPPPLGRGSLVVWDQKGKLIMADS